MWKWSRSVVSNSSQPHGLQPTRLLHPWDFPGKSTGVGCHHLLRGLGLDWANRNSSSHEHGMKWGKIFFKWGKSLFQVNGHHYRLCFQWCCPQKQKRPGYKKRKENWPTRRRWKSQISYGFCPAGSSLFWGLLPANPQILGNTVEWTLSWFKLAWVISHLLVPSRKLVVTFQEVRALGNLHYIAHLNLIPMGRYFLIISDISRVFLCFLKSGMNCPIAPVTRIRTKAVK